MEKTRCQCQLASAAIKRVLIANSITKKKQKQKQKQKNDNILNLVYSVHFPLKSSSTLER